MKWIIATIMVFISFAINARDAASLSLVGIVSDPSGAPIQGAKVTISWQATTISTPVDAKTPIARTNRDYSIETATDNAGAYYYDVEACGLVPCSVLVEMEGFVKTVKKNIWTPPSFSGLQRRVNFVLKPADGKAAVVEIDVSKEEPNPSISTLIPEDQIGKLPVVNNHVLNLVRQMGGADALLSTAREAMPGEIPTYELIKALRTGLWNSNRTAIVISVPQQYPKNSVILVLLRQPDGTYVAANASRVETDNLGKPGLLPQKAYERFETAPAEWLNRNDGLFQVRIRTRAWMSGQQYTVYEPLIIKPDGSVLWR
jgi:hypothetical protein